MDPQKEMTLKAPPTEELFGVAKKMTMELEKYPLHSHALIVTMMNSSMQHRKMELENQIALKNQAMQDDAMNAARKAHAEREAAAVHTKPPRMSIELEPKPELVTQG